MADRHALLIGVPRYDDERFSADPRLADAVRNDVAAMRAALEPSGYVVTECGIGNEERGGATPSRIRRAIGDACAAVPAGGVLLLYFSGHGVTANGTDYLVPSDAYRDQADPASVRGTLRAVPDTDVLAGCRARLVVFFVDACRDDQSGVVPTAEPGGSQPYLADGGHFVLVMGCGAGQVCQYDETGSVFTRSLAKTLDPANPARTLDAVVADVKDDMARRSRQSQAGPQVPVVRYPGMLKLAGQIEVCDGDELTDAWRKAVETSALFPSCVDKKDEVLAVVAECARRRGEAQDTLRRRTDLTDPWTDQDYPGRVLRRAELLLGDTALSPGEAAILIAAPFLREAVLAVGIKDAAGINPASFDRSYGLGARSDLELTHEMHQHLLRRATGLRRHDPGAADRLAVWLVHQWLSERMTLWDSEGAKEIYRLATHLVSDCAGHADDREIPLLLEALLFAVGAEPTDERLIRKLTSAYVDDRWRLLAAVGWLAGILAADPRRLPPVVPDLVGTRMELPLSDVRDKARHADWAPTPENTLDLSLTCEHPALHDAFEDITRRADTAAKTIRTRLSLSAALADRLPRGFTADGLRAARAQNDKPVYDVPLARFQIAEEKVRELLMGRQLYGDPTLAVRELYQNALDACRWRATRQEYLERDKQSPPPWTGLIRFTQGTEDGRPYIDCEDNGVGMDRDTLMHIFANAGERFVYGREFRAEQADWATLDPPLRMVSNSQFGVGVFSYFMIADEIMVHTRHQGRDGIPDRDAAYEVRIASSGSLLQIKPTGGMAAGGTRVRLYLAGDAAGVSALKTLRDLLWVAEYRVEAAEPGDGEVWEVGELHYQERPAPDTLERLLNNQLTSRASAVKPLKCGNDFWWVPGVGGVAADGIGTGKELLGMVVNLRGEHRPQFTVDRKTLRAWDKDWADGEADAALPGLLEWPGFTLSWLWYVADGYRKRVDNEYVEWDGDVELARRIFRFAAAAGHSVPVREIEFRIPVPLTAVGCLPVDQNLFGGYRREIGSWLLAWRKAVWQRFGYIPRASRTLFKAEKDPDWATPARTDGYPVPDPFDGTLLTNLESFPTHRSHRPSEFDLRYSLDKAGYKPIDALRRLRRYAIAGLDLSEGRDLSLSADDPASRGTEETLLAALAAWPPSGEREAAEVVARLVAAASEADVYLPGMLRRLRESTADGLRREVPDLTELVVAACPGADQVVETLGEETVADWLKKGELGPADLVRGRGDSSLPVSEVLELCASLAPLGVTVAGRETYPADLNDTEGRALGPIAKPGDSLKLLDLVPITHSAGISIHEVHSALARLERCGLLVRPVLKHIADFVPSDDEMELLGTDIDRPARRLSRNLARGIRTRPLPEPSSSKVDLRWISIIRILALDKETDSSWRTAARNMAPFLAPPDPFTYPDLVELAHSLELTIGEATAALHTVHPGVAVTPVPSESTDLAVPDWLHKSLIDNRTGDTISWRLDLFEIVKHSLETGSPPGDCLSQIGPFCRLGAPVPPCTPEIRIALNEVELDAYDADMLVSYDDQGEEIHPGTVTALHLVQTAGRLGWTLAEAARRFARLVPLGLELGYPPADLPDELVYWYDIQALTTYFDGQAPVISGPIDEAYLRRAAEEIFHDAPAGELPAKVALLRDRLRRYAPLFASGYHIAEEGSLGRPQ